MENGYQAIVDRVNFSIKVSELIQCTGDWKQSDYFSPNSCIGFIVSGEGWFKQNDSYVEPKKGQMYLLTERNIHSFGVKNGAPYKMYYCNFSDHSSIVDFFSLYHLPLCITPEDSGYIEDLFKRLIGDKGEVSLIKLMEQKVALCRLACEYIKATGATQQIDTIHPSISIIWGIVEYMHSHFKEKLSNEQLAQRLGYNREYFIRKFTQIMKCSPIKYLNNLRIKEAEYLLRDTSLSIKQISIELGFETQHYFSQVFKKLKGVTPVQYRKMYLEINCQDKES